jgi:hypothetical protein
MTDPESFEVDRRELERALDAIRDGWARGRRDVDFLYDIEAVLCARSDEADRALSSSWWPLLDHIDRPEFVETLCTLARATLEGYLALNRARRELDRACKVALAVFEPKV